MDETTRPRHGSSRWLLSILVLGAFAVLCSLGTWQVSRLYWKEALIDSVETRIHAPPQALPAVAEWPSLKADDIQYRRVAFDAVYDHSKEIHVFIALGSPKGAIGGQGYFVVTPATLADGKVILVNRGFVPLERKDPATRPEGQVTGVQHIVGLMRPPEVASWLSPANDTVKNVWFTRNPAEMAAADGIDPSAVAPFTVDAEAGEAPGGLPQGGETIVSFPNSHLQYAVTWFGLAAALVAVYVAYLLRGHGSRSREPGSKAD
ncbi:hypothetical protein HDIA_1121 [Hartmannibacter diazotrophicus]|uniref:SURF1-like protein n=2 Tax=Hartmannibacter diazotrophicus TaxID=1482074 RepID=A0A2C9D2X6_9HYPH|nr:hypothetical protein HDIA_1121 [Hartmannibacter diazotrophicus]